MFVPGLGAVTDVTRDKRHRAGDRRAPDDPPHAREPDAAPPPHEEGAAFDVDFANRFKSQIWRLGAGAEEPPPDPGLFDFFGHLNVLLLAVRDGDIERARAAADALEMEVLVERCAGQPASEPAAPLWTGNFGRLSNAADLYHDSAAAPDSPPADAPAGGAVYDTLTHYLADDALTV
ncbi:MAG: hypothetical protein KGM15_02515 [Pseudomonadota bacterium]|nr:hypothetical protein [Pseudomonadota bacterium]